MTDKEKTIAFILEELQDFCLRNICTLYQHVIKVTCGTNGALTVTLSFVEEYGESVKTYKFSSQEQDYQIDINFEEFRRYKEQYNRQRPQ